MRVRALNRGDHRTSGRSQDLHTLKSIRSSFITGVSHELPRALPAGTDRGRPRCRVPSAVDRFLSQWEDGMAAMCGMLRPRHLPSHRFRCHVPLLFPTDRLCALNLGEPGTTTEMTAVQGPPGTRALCGPHREVWPRTQRSPSFTCHTGGRRILVLHSLTPSRPS